MEKTTAKVDEKGRILIPAKMRGKMGIEPETRVEIKIERVHPSRSFVELAGSFKGIAGGKDAVKLLHEESPFR